MNLTAPTIGINTIASDDVINATEKGADLQITGTSNQPAGTTITVTLNGQNYTATTDSSGNWSATVPASAVSALGEANYTVTASVTDTAGNSNSASHNVLCWSTAPCLPSPLTRWRPMTLLTLPKRAMRKPSVGR
uniref:Ig-like domain-containing protein n=1 Tax=Escherichia coli TaxID=562 RepID=UPI0035A277FF